MNKICVSLPQLNFEKLLEVLTQIKFAEIRLDLNDYSMIEIKQIFTSHHNLIATQRNFSLEDIAHLKIAIQSGAKFADINIDNHFEGFINICSQNNCKSIVSYHNYLSTPSKSELIRICDDLKVMKTDFIKIACKVNSIEDLLNIISLYAIHKNLIAIGMDEIGKLSRICSPFLGAPFTYSSLEDHKKTASGQISNAKLVKIFAGLEEINLHLF